MNLCKFIGHKPTWMAVDNNTQGFACWRCGVRLNWDGGHGFHPSYDTQYNLEIVSVELFQEAKSHPLQKTGHWWTAQIKHKSGDIIFTPIARSEHP